MQRKGISECLEVRLARYLRYVDLGPYSELHGAWAALMEQIAIAGQSPVHQNLESNDYWHDDRATLKTTSSG